MFGICMRYASCEEDAQDMLQNGFIKVFSRLHQFRGKGSFEGWMRKIMVHTAIEFLRKDQRSESSADLWALSGTEGASSETLEGLDYKDLLAMIQKLPDGYRSVFNLYVIEGYSHKEIAALLAISEGTSKSQLLRARQWLQQKLIRLEGGNYDARQKTGV